MLSVVVDRSDVVDKKLNILIYENRVKIADFHIGDSRYNDFTSYYVIDPELAEERRKAYISRHHAYENWDITGAKTRGFWSYWLLWNKPTLKESCEDVMQRFPSINIII